MLITGWVLELSHSHSTNIGIRPGRWTTILCLNTSRVRKGRGGTHKGLR